MQKYLQRLLALPADQLRGMKRGIEKESLRVSADGHLARTPHPAALGSALTHPTITTDFSEAQVELVTGAHGRVADCLAELAQLHQAVVAAIGDERLWPSSMPGALPADADIPLGQYGRSHIGMAKTVYRRGLGHRYGRRMQTISGIHYNWSLPGLDDKAYFGLIRNFRRHAFVLLYLFGASPAVTRCFLDGQPNELQALGADTLYMPHGTSLRMGRLGYQSDAQSSLAVSYNGLDTYGATLEQALNQPYPRYEAIGLRSPDGQYQQLSTHLLQIENEFYGTIRPKRPIRPGERPLHALRQRGVEYVEVRCMDLDPFEALGISASTAHFLDVFLLHCLVSESPPDTPAEIGAQARNQHRTAARGREPGLLLERQDREELLSDWAAELLENLLPVAHRLDQVHGGSDHQDAVAQAQALLASPSDLPSARVLAQMQSVHQGEFLAFGRSRADAVRDQVRAWPVLNWQQAAWDEVARASLREQAAIEAATQGDFESFRRAYLAPEGLQAQRQTAQAA